MTMAPSARPSPRTAPTCIHHWVLDSPDGHIDVAGQCKKCGTQKRFLASEPRGNFNSSDWELIPGGASKRSRTRKASS